MDINYLDVDLDVYGEYIYPEDCTLNYGDGSGYPGSPEEFEISEVCVGDVSIMSMLSYAQLDDIAELCLLKLKQ
jgi:hypothetical protein